MLKTAILTIVFVFLSAATLVLAQNPAPPALTPPAPPPVDPQIVSQDEQAMISGVRHTDENMAALMRENAWLRTENKRLTEALEKASPSQPSVAPSRP